MKKLFFLLAISVCVVFASCAKSCYCKAPGSNTITEKEVSFNEDCKSLSNSDLVCSE